MSRSENSITRRFRDEDRLERTGRLPAVVKTRGGVRLFDRHDVEALRLSREAEDDSRRNENSITARQQRSAHEVKRREPGRR
jgi:hypothetical protein